MNFDARDNEGVEMHNFSAVRPPMAARPREPTITFNHRDHTTNTTTISTNNNNDGTALILSTDANNTRHADPAADSFAFGEGIGRRRGVGGAASPQQLAAGVVTKPYQQQQQQSSATAAERPRHSLRQGQQQQQQQQQEAHFVGRTPSDEWNFNDCDAQQQQQTINTNSGTSNRNPFEEFVLAASFGSHVSSRRGSDDTNTTATSGGGGGEVGSVNIGGGAVSGRQDGDHNIASLLQLDAASPITAANNGVGGANTHIFAPRRVPVNFVVGTHPSDADGQSLSSTMIVGVPNWDPQQQQTQPLNDSGRGTTAKRKQRGLGPSPNADGQFILGMSGSSDDGVDKRASIEVEGSPLTKDGTAAHNEPQPMGTMATNNNNILSSSPKYRLSPNLPPATAIINNASPSPEVQAHSASNSSNDTLRVITATAYRSALRRGSDDISDYDPTPTPGSPAMGGSMMRKSVSFANIPPTGSEEGGGGGGGVRRSWSGRNSSASPDVQHYTSGQHQQQLPRQRSHLQMTMTGFAQPQALRLREASRGPSVESSVGDASPPMVARLAGFGGNIYANTSQNRIVNSVANAASAGRGLVRKVSAGLFDRVGLGPSMDEKEAAAADRQGLWGHHQQQRNGGGARRPSTSSKPNNSNKKKGGYLELDGSDNSDDVANTNNDVIYSSPRRGNSTLWNIPSAAHMRGSNCLSLERRGSGRKGSGTFRLAGFSPPPFYSNKNTNGRSTTKKGPSMDIRHMRDGEDGGRFGGVNMDTIHKEMMGRRVGSIIWTRQQLQTLNGSDGGEDGDAPEYDFAATTDPLASSLSKRPNSNCCAKLSRGTNLKILILFLLLAALGLWGGISALVHYLRDRETVMDYTNNYGIYWSPVLVSNGDGGSVCVNGEAIPSDSAASNALYCQMCGVDGAGKADTCRAILLQQKDRGFSAQAQPAAGTDLTDPNEPNWLWRWLVGIDDDDDDEDTNEEDTNSNTNSSSKGGLSAGQELAVKRVHDPYFGRAHESAPITAPLVFARARQQSGAAFARPSWCPRLSPMLQGDSTSGMLAGEGASTSATSTASAGSASSTTPAACLQYSRGQWNKPIYTTMLGATFSALKSNRQAAADRDNDARRGNGEKIDDTNPDGETDLASLSSSFLLTPKCGTAEFYNSPISLHETSMATQQDGVIPTKASPTPISFPFSLRSNVCPTAFAYMKPLEMISVLYRHAWGSQAGSAASVAVGAAGKGIIFAGDEITRQLFNTIVATLRGQETIIDVSVGGNNNVGGITDDASDALYIAYATHDVLVRFSTPQERVNSGYCELLTKWFGPSRYFTDASYQFRYNQRQQPSSSSNCPSTSGASISSETPLFVLFRAWEPMASDQNVYHTAPSSSPSGGGTSSQSSKAATYNSYTFTKSQLRIGGYMYWVGDGDATLAATTSRESTGSYNHALENYLQPWLDGDLTRKQVWLTMPFALLNATKASAPLLVEDGREGSVDALTSLPQYYHSIADRNDRMRRWILSASTAAASQATQQANVLLPSQFTPRYGASLTSDETDARRIGSKRVTLPLTALRAYRKRQRGFGKAFQLAAQMLGLVGGGDGSSSTPPLQQRYLLDFAGIADVAYATVGLQTPDGTARYSCEWITSSSSSTSTGQANTTGRLKENYSHCTDPVNAAMLQWLMAQLLAIAP